MFKLFYSTAIQLFICKYGRSIYKEKEGYYCIIYIKFGNLWSFYSFLENKSHLINVQIGLSISQRSCSSC